MLHGDPSPFLDRRKASLGSATPSFSAGSRLFPNLAGTRIGMMRDEDLQPSPSVTKAALQQITACMVGPNDREDLSDALSSIPAAFTYFGQLVFHDIVFSRVFGLLPATGQAHHLKNAVSFGLDMSGLYGRGPSIDGHLYVTPEKGRSGTCHFPLGVPRATGTMEPASSGLAHGRDLPRIDMGGGFISAEGRRRPYRPLVADPRNDDNLVLSQMLATLMLIHNRLVDVQLNNQIEATVAFDKAKTFLVGAYRRTVIHDYLRRLLNPHIWALFFKEAGDFKGPLLGQIPALTGLPVEFTFGASRFAHAMVRQSYHVNDAFDVEPGRLEQLLSFSSLREDGDVPVPVHWTVDWTRFVGEGANTQKARRISPFLSPALVQAELNLTKDEDGPRSVAFMDCWRCYDLGLPTGQAVANELNRLLVNRRDEGALGEVPVLSGVAMLPTDACARRYPNSAAKLRDMLTNFPDFGTETPLFYYVLQEASADESEGDRLGPVGSYIVGATVAASLFLSPDSDVRAENVNAIGNVRTLAELLTLHDPSRKADEELIQLLN